MKNLTTLLAIAPFTFFAQNTVLTNIAPNAGNMQTVNYNYNGNSYNNNVKQTNIPAGLSNISLLNNYRSAQIINNTIAHPTNGTNAVVRSAPVRRNINRSPVAQRSRPHNSTNTVAYHRAAPTHRQQTQVANTNKINTEQQQINANPVVAIQNDNNFGEKNYNFSNNSDGNRGGNLYVNDNNEGPVQARVFAPVQTQQVSTPQNKSSNESSVSLPKIKMPEFSFGGKDRSSSAHSAKKHSLKKFFIKMGRKTAAKHHAKKKHFILDKCASWFK